MWWSTDLPSSRPRPNLKRFSSLRSRRTNPSVNLAETLIRRKIPLPLAWNGRVQAAALQMLTLSHSTLGARTPTRSCQLATDLRATSPRAPAAMAARIEVRRAEGACRSRRGLRCPPRGEIPPAGAGMCRSSRCAARPDHDRAFRPAPATDVVCLLRPVARSSGHLSWVRERPAPARPRESRRSTA